MSFAPAGSSSSLHHQHKSSSSSSHRLPSSQRPLHQQCTTTPQGPSTPSLHQTPPSAQYYNGSTASVSRQHLFRRQQEEYFPQSFPKIGLDYVDNFDNNDDRGTTRSPLVLDPSAPAQTPLHAQSTPVTPHAKTPGMMEHLFRGIRVSSSSRTSQDSGTPSSSFSPSRPNHRQSSQVSSQNHNKKEKHQQQSSTLPYPPPTATEFARRAPQAGFLQKLGTNIPTYKRRFFVLQPSTQLYYFLSPHDTIPRGSIAIDDAQIKNRHELPDGRTRFSLEWPNGSQVYLEARSPEIADNWCQSLQQERLSFVRGQLEDCQQDLAQAHCEIDDLKRQIEHYRFVEQDRDGALEDARRWKEQFELLDESIRLLANHVRKLPSPKDATTPAAPPANKNEVDSHTDSNGNPEKEGEDAVDNGIFKTEVDDRVATRIVGCYETETKSIGYNNANKESKNLEMDAVVANKTILSTPEAKDEPQSSTNEEEIKEDDEIKGIAQQQKDDDEHSTNDDNIETDKSCRDISLLDDDAAAEAAAALLFESNNIIEDLNAPGQHFPSLVNACQQLRENLRLASEEAAAAVEDTKVAHANTQALQARMTKAEKQLCQLWEENCSIRKTLKQKKREKRVLVREVKSMMEQQQLQQQKQQHYVRDMEQLQQSGKYGARLQRASREGDDDNSTIIGSDEERLINELEEHVVSSIRLHEEFLSASGKLNQQTQKKMPIAKLGDGVAPSSSSTATTSESTSSGAGHSKMTRQSTNSTNTTAIVQNLAVRPNNKNCRPAEGMHEAPLASLFDRSASDSESETERDEGDVVSNNMSISVLPTYTFANLKPDDDIEMKKPVYDDIDGRSISSVAASFGGESTSSIGRSGSSTPLRPNPVLQLDQSEEEQDNHQQHELDNDKRFKPISVAQRGTATSRLVCPLADVVTTKPNRQVKGPAVDDQDLTIYHLTFYTRKIGLQFQKVPAPPTKARGLLTDAMTADLTSDPNGGCKTAAELKRVAAISNWANATNDGAHSGSHDADTCLQVATPIDAVLVCGFEGFDDSGNNVRPKLGARLVAFDGISVEVGKWTFDSIRKSIQARGRPLTLSFRNDFLTVDQREIMTKVVAQMEKEKPQATPARFLEPNYYPFSGSDVDYRDSDRGLRPSSIAPSLQSAISHETDHFVNEATLKTSNTIHLPSEHGELKRPYDEEDDLTVSTTGYHSDQHYQHHNPHQQFGRQQRRFTASSGGSYSSGRPSYYKYRSFSEAGSSASALSSAIGPLMSNLMSGLSAEKKRVNMTPDYLHRRDRVENVPQHHDFQSNLL